MATIIGNSTATIAATINDDEAYGEEDEQELIWFPLCHSFMNKLL